MKATYILVFITLFSYNRTEAQPLTTFHRGYIDTTTGFSFNQWGPNAMIETTNGDFLNAFADHGLMRTDATGKSRWMLDYRISGQPSSKNIVFNQMLNLPGTTEVLLFGRTKKTEITGQDTMILIRSSVTGSVMWSKLLVMSAPVNLVNRKSIVTANGEILICASNEWAGGNNFTITTRMTTDGNIIWQHYYLNYPNQGLVAQSYTWDVVECTNGDFVISGFGTAPANETIWRINSMGVLQWAKNYGTFFTGIHRIREISGGNLRALVDDNRWGNYPAAYFTTDANGNIVGTGKGIKTPYYSEGFIFPSGDMLFNIYSASKPGIVKVSNAGNIIFANTYSPPVSYAAISKVVPTADGGIAAGGGTPSANGRGNDGYLVKTDAAGISAPYSMPVTVSDTPYVGAIAAVVSLKDSVVNIPFQDVSISTLPLYLRDTLYALSLDVAAMPLSSQRLIYPNPAKDVIHFSGNVSLNAGIYSADGRLMKAAKGVSNVDISDLSAGVYFIMLKNEKGVLQGLERFIKE